jgi:hypothetical protein
MVNSSSQLRMKLFGAALDAAATSVRADGLRTLTQINGASMRMREAGKSLAASSIEQHDLRNHQHAEKPPAITTSYINMRVVLVPNTMRHLLRRFDELLIEITSATPVEKGVAPVLGETGATGGSVP